MWLPLVVLGVSLAIKSLNDSGYDELYDALNIGERGFMEQVSLVMLAAAVVYASVSSGRPLALSQLDLGCGC